MIELMRIKQKQGKNVLSYCAAFTNLTVRLEGLDEPISSSLKMHRFIDGLQGPLQAVVRLGCPKDFIEAMDVAKHLERRGVNEAGLLLPLFRNTDTGKSLAAPKPPPRDTRWNDAPPRDFRNGRNNDNCNRAAYNDRSNLQPRQEQFNGR